MGTRTISVKERAFVEYLVSDAHYSVTRAAQLAGYRYAIYSGREVLERPRVQQYLQARLQESIITREETLQLLTDIAREDMKWFYNNDGVIDLSMESAKQHSQLIRSVRQKERKHYAKDGTYIYSDLETSIELWDKVSVLALVSKFHGLTNDTTVQQHIINNSLVINTHQQEDLIAQAGLNEQEVWNELELMMSERKEKLLEQQVERGFNIKNIGSVMENSSAIENDSSTTADIRSIDTDISSIDDAALAEDDSQSD